MRLPVERVGDLAANVGGYAAAGDPDGVTEVDVLGIGSEVHEQLSAALAAYEEGEPRACREVVAGDDRVDALCARASERVVRALVEEGDAWDVERAVDDASRALLVVRDLERVGDHAVNVAARTLYAVESDPELVR